MDNRSSLKSSQLSPSDAAASSMKEGLAAVLRWLKLAAEPSDEEVENVHQLRIAIRRATAAMELFENFLPASCADQLLGKLKKLRKVAGTVRDNDVLAARITPDAFGIAVYSLGGQLAERRIAARAKLAALYEKWERGECLERLATEALCAIRPRRKQSQRTGESYQAFARRRLRLVSRPFVQAMAVTSKHPKRLHEFRLRVKSLRYRLELLRGGFPEKCYDKVYQLVKKNSQRLGEINDHAMAETMLDHWRNDSDQQSTAKLLKRASARESQSLKNSLVEFSEWWSPRRQQRLRRRLKSLVNSPAEPVTITTKPSALPRIRPAK